MEINGDPTELINQVAPLCNSGLVPSIASVPLPRYAAFIHYIQHLLTHAVDMPYINNSWSLKEFKDELKKINSARTCVKSELHINPPAIL